MGLKKRKPKAPAPPEEVLELVEASRMKFGGAVEGDIVASYSADCICEGRPIRKPFPLRGGFWVCVSTGPGPTAEAYRLVSPAVSAVTPATYSDKTGSEKAAAAARKDPNGFYHGVGVKSGGQVWIMTGPPITFTVGEVGQGTLPGAPPIAGEADTMRESQLEAERVTLEFRQKSSKRLDAGKVPILESPLFDGPAQGDLFGGCE